MRNWKLHRCLLCKKPYKEIGAFENHMRNEHPGEIPEGWSIRRYVYFIHTGQTAGKCRVCGKPTGWNEAGGKYVRLCTSPECKEKYRNKFMADMRARRGIEKPMDDPKIREKMLVNRRISGVHEFQDGGKVPYMGQLEKHFIEMLDTFFRFPSADIIGPSPNRYVYYYDNPEDPERKGEHIYVPDFYIPSLNLEIELKSAKNERPDHLKIDVVRDAFKDVRMIRDPSVNYIKIYEDDYHVFFQVFADFAAAIDIRDMPPVKYISRSLLTSVYLQYIPEDCLKTIRKYIYKYSEASVMKMKPATEADGDNPDAEVAAVVVEDPGVINERYETPSSFADDIYANDVREAIHDAEEVTDEEPEETVSVGLDPYIYYALADEVTRTNTPVMESLHLFEFPEESPVSMKAMEGFLTGGNIDGVDAKTTAGRAAVQNSRWRDKLFTKGSLGKLTAKMTVQAEVRGDNIYVSGINCNLLLYRLKECYDESRLKYIFDYVYNPKSLKQFNAKKISRGAMKIDSIHSPTFFAMELVAIFTELAERYRDSSYEAIAQTIYENTWLAKADQITLPDLDLGPLSNLNLELLPHQKEFIRNWDRCKARLNMHGYILAFQPGKGKTLTSIGLSECIRATHVWIICPNNLKDNWALEIKKYYNRYAMDDALWKHDVRILDGKTDIKGAKFIITNNESIKNMQAVAFKDPDSLVIVDECHNFRNYFGTRSAELFKVMDTIGSNNVLCMSATPIKAAPSEITPALRCIDPTFTDEVAKMYAKCFAIDDVAAMRIIEKRFGLIMWRPAVSVSLPAKTVGDLSLPIQGDESRFYMETVHEEIVALFHIKHDKWRAENKAYIEEFQKLIKEWSKGADPLLTNEYLEWTSYMMNSTRVSEDAYHELMVQEFQQYIDKYIEAPRKCPTPVITKLRAMERTITTAAKVAMGQAIGEILPVRRNEMYISVFHDNIDTFVDMIRKRSKKTVIFSTMVPVVNSIYKELNAAGVKTVMITGAVNNRLPILTAFKEDQTVEVLVATSQTLGVGLTLTEASQMFFFGTPWRSADYDQACDRIWRIGQTDEVNIYSVMLASKRKNLSQRMKDILEWSGRMFSAAITDTAAIVGEEPATEAHRYDVHYTPEENMLLSYYQQRSSYRYGFNIDGKLVEMNDPNEEIDGIDRYTVMAPDDFNKKKGGTCYDYSIDFYFWHLAGRIWHTAELYYIWMGEEYSCHLMPIISSGSDYYWVECADKGNMGVYKARSIHDILSCCVNTHPHGDRVEVFRLKPEMPRILIGLTHEALVDYVTSKAHHISGFKPNQTRSLPNIAALQAAYEMETPIQFGGDYRYTQLTDEQEMETVSDLAKLHTLHNSFRYTFWVTPRAYDDVPIFANVKDAGNQSDWNQSISMALDCAQICPKTEFVVIVIHDMIDGTMWCKPTVVIPWAEQQYLVPDIAPCPGGDQIGITLGYADIAGFYYQRYTAYRKPEPPYYRKWNERYLNGMPQAATIIRMAPENAQARISSNPKVLDFVNSLIREERSSTLRIDLPRHPNFYTLQILNRGVVTSHLPEYCD